MTQDPIIVEVEGLGELEFPTGTDPSVIQATVKRLTNPDRTPPSAEQQRQELRDSATPLATFTRQNPEYKNLIESAATGGMSGAAPRLVSGVIQKGAERVYGGLLKPAKAIRESFPGVIKTALKERAPISEGGLAKITDRMAKSRNTAMGMVQAAESSGAPGVTGRQAMSEFPEVVGELRKRSDIGQPNELARVGQRGSSLLKTATRGQNVDIPLTRAQALKETAQNAASGAYRQMEKGGSKQLSADDLLDKATATGLRKGIESRVPSVGPQNARTQELIGVSRALEDATGREANNLGFGGMRDLIAAGAGGALGGVMGGPAGGAAGAGGALLMRLLSTPSTGSRMAIGANELAKLPIDELVRMAQMQSLRDEQ